VVLFLAVRQNGREEAEYSPRATNTEKITAVQNGILPKSTTTSSTKSELRKNEYTMIHKSITTDEPNTTSQVMTVQLHYGK
jgi:hypothetical protein